MMLRKVYNDPPNGERVHARRYVDRDPSLWVCGMRAIKYIFSRYVPNVTQVPSQPFRRSKLDKG